MINVHALAQDWQQTNKRPSTYKLRHSCTPSIAFANVLLLVLLLITLISFMPLPFTKPLTNPASPTIRISNSSNANYKPLSTMTSRHPQPMSCIPHTSLPFIKTKRTLVSYAPLELAPVTAALPALSYWHTSPLTLLLTCSHPVNLV